MIYLDHNATTTMPPEVIEAISATYAAGFANPASQHADGRRAKAALAQIRDEIRQRVGARDAGYQSDRVIFTSGGTEANNLAIRGLCGDPPGRVIISSIEHPCIAGAAGELGRLGFDIVRLPCAADGIASLDALRSNLTAETRLVSLMLANHETGVIQPVAQASEICREFGVPLHSDAVQAVGKIPVRFDEFGRSGADSICTQVPWSPRNWGTHRRRWRTPESDPIWGRAAAGDQARYRVDRSTCGDELCSRLVAAADCSRS